LLPPRRKNVLAGKNIVLTFRIKRLNIVCLRRALGWSNSTILFFMTNPDSNLNAYWNPIMPLRRQIFARLCVSWNAAAAFVVHHLQKTD